MRTVRGYLGWLGVGTVLLATGYAPVARVPLVGDDFHAFLFTYGEVNGSAFQALRYGWRAGQEAGHFNPVGQALGALYHFVAYALPATTGLPPRVVDVVAGAALLWVTALAVAWCAAWALRHARVEGELLVARSFAVTSAALAGSLQLHPWSNDPVSSYLMAGWASAALGFVVLGLALRAVSPGRGGWGDVVALGVAGVLAVLWYEMLTGVVAGVAAVLVGAGVRAGRSGKRRAVRRVLALGASGVVLPAVVFVVGRFASAADGRGYTGTALGTGTAALRSTWAAVLGVLPGGAWSYLTAAAGPVPLAFVPGVLAAVYVVALGAIVALWRRHPVHVASPHGLVIPAVGIVVAWAATTATQTFTVKYASEIQVPGQVYLFHVVALGCLAALAVLAACAATGRWHGSWSRGARTAGAALLGVVVVVQLTISWHLADFMTGAFDGNIALTGAAVDGDLDQQQRCAILLRWADRPWPDYYRTAVVRAVERTYEVRFGEAFCASSAELEQLVPDVMTTAP